MQPCVIITNTEVIYTHKDSYQKEDKMSLLLTGISALFLGGQAVKQATTPTIPASYWRNRELMNADKLNPNISPEQVQRNLESGKYYLSDEEYNKRKQNAKPDLSFREGENINSWMDRLARERYQK